MHRCYFTSLGERASNKRTIFAQKRSLSINRCARSHCRGKRVHCRSKAAKPASLPPKETRFGAANRKKNVSNDNNRQWERARTGERESERVLCVCVLPTCRTNSLLCLSVRVCSVGFSQKEQTNTKPLRDAIRNVSEVLGFELRFAYSAALYINIYLVGHRDFSTSCQRSVQRAYTHTHAPRKEWERERVSNGNNNKSLSAATFLVMSSESKLIFSLCAVCFSVFFCCLLAHTQTHTHTSARNVVMTSFNRNTHDSVLLLLLLLLLFSFGGTWVPSVSNRHHSHNIIIVITTHTRHRPKTKTSPCQSRPETEIET